jgi:hypothetical protein
MRIQINKSDIRLVQTCGACPEQYDAFYKEEQVGYLRLRHGCFSVQYPDVGGEDIYEATPRGDGLFESSERQYYLDMALNAIVFKYNHQDDEAEEDEYEGY